MRRVAIPPSLSRAFLIGLSLAAAGCEGLGQRTVGPEPKPAPPVRSNAILDNTVGSVTALAGAGGLQVRGYSLVIGLGDQGSTECPAALRDYLINYLTKNYRLSDSSEPKGPPFSPAKMIDSPDTAVVEVVGEVPPGAAKGTRFDVRIEAVPGTQTRSLDGGYLWPCELKIVDLSARGDRLIAGRTVGYAAGPVFLNPFADSAASADPRRALVLGGGWNTERRNLRLTLFDPSYALTRRIEQRINERFGATPKTCEAVSKGVVEVRTPAAWADQPLAFMRLVAHLPLYSEPAVIERRLDELAAVAEAGATDGEDLALSWEAVGRLAIAKIQPFYASPHPAVAFAALRAGLRLGDASAIVPMTHLALDPAHTHRERAIAELGRATQFPAAGNALLPLLDAEPPPIRVAAYEALLRHKHPAVQSHRLRAVLDVNEDSFWLDVLQSSASPFVYVQRTGRPRLAVFGRDLNCRTPLFYSHPSGLVTLNAVNPDSDITLFCRTRVSNRLSDPIPVTPRLVDLILSLADLPVKDSSGRIRGIGLNYGQVVGVLDALSKQDSIPIRLVLQTATMSELLGPGESPERPEADTSPEPEPAAPRGENSTPPPPPTPAE